MSLSNATYLATVAQTVLGLVFLLSVISKIRHPAAFIRTVLDYKLLPRRVSILFGSGLIPTELFTSISLLTGDRTGAGIPLAVGLLATFIVAVAVNLRRGRSLACGCFGDASEIISGATLARLGLLICLAALVWISDLRGAHGPAGDLTGLVLGFASAACVLLIGAWLFRIAGLATLYREIVAHQKPI